jgi:hypothetical protein
MVLQEMLAKQRIVYQRWKMGGTAAGIMLLLGAGVVGLYALVRWAVGV